MTFEPKPMALGALVERAGIPEFDISGSPNAIVADIQTRAQSASRNGMFVAIRGTQVDGHLFLSEAVERGASVLVVERDVPAYPGTTILRVDNTRRALGPLAHAFHGRAAAGLRTSAVTGTNGKTTTAWLMQSVMEAAGMKAAFVGTIGAYWGGALRSETITTPDALDLARLFARMRSEGVEALSMEASSHGIDQGRLCGMPVHAGALTGITQDHLDYHGSYPSYIATKRRLFFDHVLPTPGGVACLNVSDHTGEELCFSYPGEIVRFSPEERGEADVLARSIRSGVDGTDFEMVVGDRSVPVRSRMIGRFSVTNMLAAASMATAMGIDPETIARGIARATPVAGRFESVRAGQPFLVIVDYAHTPDALEKVLRAARRLTAGNLIAVFGCGGDRDTTKRPLMGKASARLSDYIVVTSDNPRSEDPQRIALMAVDGIRKMNYRGSRYEMILDRAHAIEKALHLARPGDCVMICGKGHEDYQEIDGVRHAFDDRAVATAILSTMKDNWSRIRGASAVGGGV